MKTFAAVILLFLLGVSLDNVAEARPSNSEEGTENEARSKRNAQLPNLSGSTIVGGSHNFGTKTYTQTTQNNINNGKQPHSSTTTATIQETPGLLSSRVITVGEKDSQTIQTITQQAPKVFVKKCVYQKVPQNHVQIIKSNGHQTFFSNGDQNAGTQIISQPDGTTITQSPQGQIIKTPSGTITQGFFGRKRRSPQTFGYQGSTQIYNGGSKFQGGSHNFGTEFHNQNQQSFGNFGPSGQLTTITQIQEPGNYVERCHFEEVSNPDQLSTLIQFQTPSGKQKRSAQNFGYNNSQQNYGGGHFQGGSHNFGSLQNYGGSHFQGGKHNFGQQSYGQNRWNSRWY